MSGPTGVNHPIDQCQGAPFLVSLRNKSDRRSAGAIRAWECRPDGLGAAKLFIPGRDVQRMQGLSVSGNSGRNLHGHRHEVDGIGGRVNDRRIRDADHGGDLGAVTDIGDGNGGNPCGGIQETVLPIGHSRRIGIKGIGAVIFRNYVNHIVGSTANADLGHVERLGVDLAVHGI